MKSSFVSYGVANSLIDIGFNERCPGQYRTLGSIEIEEGWCYVGQDPDIIPAPTYTQVLDWFHSKYNLLSTIDWFGDIYCYGFKVTDLYDKDVVIAAFRYETYDSVKESLVLSLISYYRKTQRR